MVLGIMAKDKTKNRRAVDLIVLLVIIVCILLVLVELANNVMAASAG